MTEAEWLACKDPMKMYTVVTPLSRRLAVLFGAACVRATPGKEEQSLLPRAVEAVEQSANSSEEWGGVEILHHEAESVFDTVKIDSRPHFWALATYRLTDSSVTHCWMHVPFFLRLAVAEKDGPAAAALGGVYADFLRDVTGNPFRGGRDRRSNKRSGKPRPEPLFRSEWGTSVVLALAGEADETGDFSALPILADALEDAGCTDEPILSHLRSPGPHVRGCWVVDAILGKE